MASLTVIESKPDVFITRDIPIVLCQRVEPFLIFIVVLLKLVVSEGVHLKVDL